MKPRYDVAIIGAGHNGLVAASYLSGAGLSVLLLERSEYVGGATTSQRVFPDFDAHLSRYSYLVSLFPDKIIADLGLRFELRRRAVASFTPYVRNGRRGGLLLSNLSDAAGRASMRLLTGNEAEYESLGRFYRLSRLFAENVWDSMLEPLPSRAELRDRFGTKDEEEAWNALVEEPLGVAVERYLEDDLVRGLVFTDAKIGVFTHPHDTSLVQNRCFLYHLIGNKTGEWKVPVGGMGAVVAEIERVARAGGSEIHTRAAVSALRPENNWKTLECTINGQDQTVEARFVLANCGRNVLYRLAGQVYQPEPVDEGSVFKINMLLRRLPRLKDGRTSPAEAFGGTFHSDEGYGEMMESHDLAARGLLPEKAPCEIYCHTLTDDSILGPDLRRQGYHTMTLFGLDTPWRLFSGDNEAMRARAEERFLASINQWLAEPLQECLARTPDGRLCLESKSPIDIEDELQMYRGNIFHDAPTFPFAETREETGTWGVETEWDNVFLCGSAAKRGGAVSGIPGHNAAMKVLEVCRHRR